MGFNPFSGRSLLAIGTLGGSELLGEDTMSKIPVLNSIGGYKSDSEKRLLEQQKKTAEEAEKRARQNQQERMQTLGQSMLAFNPQNQMMAQMFGPQAAFSPQQFAQMAGDPGAKTRAEYEKARHESIMSGPIDPKTRSRQVGAPMDFTAQDKERMLADERRRAMLEANMRPLPAGPTPLRSVNPQAGRRF